jgi:flagellar hook-associated protein 2
MAITSVGTGSGIDLEGLITKIVDSERTPVENRLNLKQTTIEARISALGSIKATLSEFQASLAKLKSGSLFSGRSAVSGDDKLFTATATSSAGLGNYAIEVIDMAKANKLATTANFAAADTVVGSGTLNISVGTSSFDVDITAGTNDTLVGIRDAINNATNNAGVRASILTVSDGMGGSTRKLVLTANNTGAANTVSVAVTGDGDGIDNDAAGLSQLISANLTEIDPAQDARITIDGFDATSGTNQFSSAIEGVTLTVLKENPDPLAEPYSASLSVAVDKTGAKGAIEGFVANYNALVTIFNTLTNYNPTDGTRGLLSGDASVNVMERRLRAVLNDTVAGAADGMNSLAFLGIKTNRDGSIALDDTKLSAALSGRFGDLEALFSGDNGIATRLDKIVTELTGSGGVFNTRETAMREQLGRIDDQRDQLELRLTKIEARYRKQFSALDILVGQLNQTGNFLTQQLDAVSAMINRKQS